MNITVLKKYWSKILSWRDYDREKKLINSSRAWFGIVIFFLVSLIFLTSSFILLKFQISHNEQLVMTDLATTTEKLDEQKLKLILLDHTKKVEEFSKLELEKPLIRDPGL